MVSAFALRRLMPDMTPDGTRKWQMMSWQWRDFADRALHFVGSGLQDKV